MTLVRGQLTKLERAILGALIVIEVCGTDIRMFRRLNFIDFKYPCSAIIQSLKCTIFSISMLLKISLLLFSMPSSHDPVNRIFHCISIDLKISLFFMLSSHDLVIRIFHCLSIDLKNSLFSMSSSLDPFI